MASIKYVIFIPEQDTADDTQTELRTRLCYRVVFDGPGGLALQADVASGVDTHGTATAIPGRGDELVVGGIATGLFCASKHVYREGDPISFMVEVEFSSSAGGTTGLRNNFSMNGDGEESTEQVSRFVDGKVIASSAHQLMRDVTATSEDSKFTLSWDILAGFFDPTAIDFIRGTVNNADITMTIAGSTWFFPQYELRCKRATYTVSESIVVEGLTTVDTIHVELEFLWRQSPAGATLDDDQNPPVGWQSAYADEGTIKLVSGTPTSILDPSGNPISDPVPLDGSGGVLALSGGPSEHLVKGFHYESADFTSAIGSIDV